MVPVTSIGAAAISGHLNYSRSNALGSLIPNRPEAW